MRYMANQPYSLRLGPETIRQLSEEAGRLRVPARTLAQELVEEGLRLRRHPGISFIERASGRRAALTKRPRLSVAQVVQSVRASADLSEAAAYLDLSLSDLERALDYYADFTAEIDAEIEQRQRDADREEHLARERERLLKR